MRAVPREGARRAGRETGCPGNGGKRGLVRGQTSVMAATECVGNALFRKVLFACNQQFDADRAVSHVGELILGHILSFSEIFSVEARSAPENAN